MKQEIHHALGKMYRFLSLEEQTEALNLIKEIIEPYGLTAEFEAPGAMSRGVQGDEPTYTRVITLKGPYPGNNILSEVSSKISNKIPVNRVHFQIS